MHDWGFWGLCDHVCCFVCGCLASMKIVRTRLEADRRLKQRRKGTDKEQTKVGKIPSHASHHTNRTGILTRLNYCLNLNQLQTYLQRARKMTLTFLSNLKSESQIAHYESATEKTNTLLPQQHHGTNNTQALTPLILDCLPLYLQYSTSL